ncbi:capsid cement protein [Methanococcoides sp. FTZ1]|uniref:capsid cement protein n=1 Tax=Methanococcoides sp. FTZ1 TaxID=3439061 RepID=UPI003F8457AB
MADTGTWITISKVLDSGDNLQTFTAGADIKAGMVVAGHGTGVSDTVHPCVAGTTAFPIGVAIEDAASGAPVTVACVGCVCYVREGTGNAIDAWSTVSDDDAAATGCIKTAVTTAEGFAIGVTIDDIAANGSGRIMILPQLISKSDQA